MIDTRLRYRRTLVSEDHIVRNIYSLKKMDTGNGERRHAARSIAWMTSAESVRLKYFEELAK